MHVADATLLSPEQPERPTGERMDRIYLHCEQRSIETLLARIRGESVSRRKNDANPMYDQPVPEPNRGKLLGFYRGLVTEELSLGRIGVLLGNMYRVSIWLEHRPFEELTREDIIDLIQKIKSIRVKRRAKAAVKEGYAEQTIESYKMTIKKFWKWLEPQSDPEAYPPAVSWIKRRKGKNGLLPKDIWTPKEVNKLASLAGNTRDKAFVLGLFGSGCRIGEFLPLRRRDATFDRYSCQIVVEGKTGSRRVRLTPAASLALAAWLDVHPNRAPEAFVWTHIQTRWKFPERCLSYDWAHKMLNGLAKRAEIDKPIRPHLFRHSLATYYASRLTEAVMNEHFGWRQGSRTAAIYTHLSGRQVDDQLLAVFGKKKVDPQTNKAVDVVYCPRCNLENVPASAQCRKCGFPLSDEAAQKLSTRRERADRIMDAVAERPELREVLVKAIAEAVNKKPDLLEQRR